MIPGAEHSTFRTHLGQTECTSLPRSAPWRRIKRLADISTCRLVILMRARFVMSVCVCLMGCKYIMNQLPTASNPSNRFDLSTHSCINCVTAPCLAAALLPHARAPTLPAFQLLLLLTQHTTPTTVLGNRSDHEYVVEGRVEDQTLQIALWFLSF